MHKFFILCWHNICLW